MSAPFAAATCLSRTLYPCRSPILVCPDTPWQFARPLCRRSHSNVRQFADGLVMFDDMLRPTLRHPDIDRKLQRDFTSATATTACVGSSISVRAFRLAPDTKLESHSASSHAASAGISAGGAEGSNVCMAKVTGCLSIVRLGTCLAGRDEGGCREVSPTRRTIPVTRRAGYICAVANALRFSRPVKSIQSIHKPPHSIPLIRRLLLH